MLKSLKFSGQSKQQPPKGTESQAASAQPEAPLRHPQYASQLAKIQELYQLFHGKPSSPELTSKYQSILDALQSYNISELLRDTFHSDQIAKFKEYALTEYKEMGSINRERVKLLTDLSNAEMHQVIFEILFLFDQHPQGAPPLELEGSESFDAKGMPVIQNHSYPIFELETFVGVAGGTRFLPVTLIEGDAQKGSISMKNHLSEQFPQLTANSAPANTNPYIKALTTIGSLGGIGHKPDSDMDLQVIINTNPEYNHRWNDADFYIALITKVVQQILQNFYQSVMPAAMRLTTVQKVMEQLKAKYYLGLNEDELKFIDQVFPSSFQVALEKELWPQFHALSPQQQGGIVYKQLVTVLNQNPYFEKYGAYAKAFFPILNSILLEKFLTVSFPFSLSNLSKDRFLNLLGGYYEDRYLGKSAQAILRQYAQTKNVELSAIPTMQQKLVLLDHLSRNKQRATVLKAFMGYLAEGMSIDQKAKLAEILLMLQKQFDPQAQFLTNKILGEAGFSLSRAFRTQMVGLVNVYSEREAMLKEAQFEYGVHRKIQMVEDYLLHKYPDTEVHLFKNILRKQRVGQHTPFLVSPEGSMAYSLMLNDFLLNPAVVLCGISPAPFELPHDFKTMGYIGALGSDALVLVQQTHDEKSENFNFATIPDWGEIDIPREKIWAHALPIFLRESEKVSHRNLPKALLNCWWLEMICLLEDDNAIPTSLTRLLWDPKRRSFVKNNLQDEITATILALEAEFPQLLKDPWWLKFTEMVTRFSAAKIRRQIIFCFAQHVRISDIIDYNNDGKPIWLDKNVTWRTKSLVSFYTNFFKEEQERITLIKFSQGRDDIANLMEEQLKQAFLDSMVRVEQKLISIGNERAVRAIVKYLLKNAGSNYAPQTLEPYLRDQLVKVQNRILLVDENVLAKAKNDEPLSAVETHQLEEIRQDRLKLKECVNLVMNYLGEISLPGDPDMLETIVLDSRLKMAGDAKENVIFKYHFERNFKHKPYQVHLPISKSLSIPRQKIMIELHPRHEKWVFKSVLSKKEASKGASSGSSKAESIMEMFEENMVEGLAKCVFSGYIGFTTKNLTSFEKPAVKQKSEVGTNSFNHQDLQDLTFTIKEYFTPFKVRPRELLENVHYIRDIMMVCCVNRLMTISLIVRDNFGEFFVISFPLDEIKVKVLPSLQLTKDENFPKFYLRLHSKECRLLILKALADLKIKISQAYKPKLKIWVNHGNFDLPIAPKFLRVYVDGIANELIRPDTIGTPLFIHPKMLEGTFDTIGKRAIQLHQEIEAQKKQLLEKARQKNAIAARAYNQKRRNELGL